MADRDRLRQQRERGAHAQRILEDPLVQEAFEAIERKITEGWRETDPDDQDRREKAWMMSKLFQRFREHLEEHMRTGKNAQRELLAIEEREGRLRRMRRAIRT